MTRTEYIRLFAMFYSVREYAKGKDPGECVRYATYWVDRMLDLTPEAKPKLEAPKQTPSSPKKKIPPKSSGH